MPRARSACKSTLQLGQDVALRAASPHPACPRAVLHRWTGPPAVSFQRCQRQQFSGCRNGSVFVSNPLPEPLRDCDGSGPFSSERDGNGLLSG